MTTSLNNATPAREAGYEMVQYICGRVVNTAATPDLSVKIGTIPAGSVILMVSTRIVTTFAGGTPVVGVGTTPTLIGATGNIITGIAITAGSLNTVPSATIAEPLAADTDIYIGTSGASTSGDMVAAVLFIKPLA